MPIFKKLPQKRTAYLEQFRDRLHGKDDPAWNDAKEGDFIMQFQGADLKKEKNSKLDHDNSYAEDQFRHVAVIVKIIHAQDLKKSEFRVVAGRLLGNKMSDKEMRKLTKDERELVREREESEQKILSKQFDEYVERAYRENHRLASTMGAGSKGVGITNDDWGLISKDTLNWDSHNMLWHDLDEDWCGKGIIRTGNTAQSDKIEKVYLFK